MSWEICTGIRWVEGGYIITYRPNYSTEERVFKTWPEVLAWLEGRRPTRFGSSEKEP